jgi:hypothetical protein
MALGWPGQGHETLWPIPAWPWNGPLRIPPKHDYPTAAVKSIDPDEAVDRVLVQSL